MPVMEGKVEPMPDTRTVVARQPHLQAGEAQRFDLLGRSVFVAGHTGMVGQALVRRLSTEPCRLLTVDRGALDLRRPDAVVAWMDANRPDVVIVAAARVGGILANATEPVDFLSDNLAIANAVIPAAHTTGVRKLLYLGSSCIYPRHAPQPIREDALLTGPLEPTNQWYALAKIAGIKLCEAFRRQMGFDAITAMPTNLYGPGDRFDPERGHVLPALMHRAHRAKQTGAADLEVWGTGTPRREFLHVDDLADGLVHLLKHYSGPEPVNVGTGQDIAIADLAALICRTVGFDGRITYRRDRPDGMPRKRLDTSRMRGLGWQPRIGLREGIAGTYAWYRAHVAKGGDRHPSRC